jgi:hypothetical protein
MTTEAKYFGLVASIWYCAFGLRSEGFFHSLEFEPRCWVSGDNHASGRFIQNSPFRQVREAYAANAVYSASSNVGFIDPAHRAL